jgi:hypothetical protein
MLAISRSPTALSDRFVDWLAVRRCDEGQLRLCLHPRYADSLTGPKNRKLFTPQALRSSFRASPRVSAGRGTPRRKALHEIAAEGSELRCGVSEPSYRHRHIQLGPVRYTLRSEFAVMCAQSLLNDKPSCRSGRSVRFEFNQAGWSRTGDLFSATGSFTIPAGRPLSPCC